MKKSLKTYYGLLSLAIIFQLVFTVLTLSQNVGYGQKIDYLEKKQASLLEEKTNIEQALSEKISMKALEEKSKNYQNIDQVFVVHTGEKNLASR